MEPLQASLAREVDAWKGRVQSLVSKFNTIDPEEHVQALASVEASKKEVQSLMSTKARVEKEAASAKTLVSRLNKELTQRKTELEAAKTSLAKVTAEKNSLSKKSSAADTSVAKERLQLKQALKNKEEELASSKAEMESANNRIEGLKKIMGKLKQQNVDMQKKSKAAEAKQQETEKALEKEHEVLKEKQALLAKCAAQEVALSALRAEIAEADEARSADAVRLAFKDAALQEQSGWNAQLERKLAVRELTKEFAALKRTDAEAVAVYASRASAANGELSPVVVSVR